MRNVVFNPKVDAVEFGLDGVGFFLSKLMLLRFMDKLPLTMRFPEKFCANSEVNDKQNYPKVRMNFFIVC